MKIRGNISDKFYEHKAEQKKLLVSQAYFFSNR